MDKKVELFFFEIGHYLLSIYSETNLLFCDNFRVYQRCPSPKNKKNNKERVETMHQPLEVKNYDGYDNVIVMMMILISILFTGEPSHQRTQHESSVHVWDRVGK